MDNKNLDKTSKGWTLKNILIGGVCVAIGWLIGSFNAVFGLFLNNKGNKIIFGSFNKKINQELLKSR